MPERQPLADRLGQRTVGGDRIGDHLERRRGFPDHVGRDRSGDGSSPRAANHDEVGSLWNGPQPGASVDLDHGCRLRRHLDREARPGVAIREHLGLDAAMLGGKARRHLPGRQLRLGIEGHGRAQGGLGRWIVGSGPRDLCTQQMRAPGQPGRPGRERIDLERPRHSGRADLGLLEISGTIGRRRRAQALPQLDEPVERVSLDLVRDRVATGLDRIGDDLVRRDRAHLDEHLDETLPRGVVDRSLVVPRDADRLGTRRGPCRSKPGDEDARRNHDKPTFSRKRAQGYAPWPRSGVQVSHPASVRPRPSPRAPKAGNVRPKLRKVDRFAHDRSDQSLVILRDPLGLCDPFAIDADFAPVLDLLDGSRTVAQIRQSLLLRGALDLPGADLASFVDALSEAGWLDDDRFASLWAQAHTAFLETDPRAPTLAGTLYPSDPGALRAELRCALPDAPRIASPSSVVGIVAPHGPAKAVGTILDRTLRELPRPDDVDVLVILGTDHGTGRLPYAVTHRRYATPLGTVPPATPLLQALERRLPWAFREEIRHRGGLSIELAVLYLQAVYADACPPLLPVLCGRTVLSSSEQAPHVDAFIGTLETLLEGRRVLWWASAELSHAGVAYGRPEVTASIAADIAARDEACLDALRIGKARVLAQRCAQSHPQGRPSGGAALTTLARLLPVGYRAELTGYEATIETTRAAPGAPSGLVGMAGMRIHAPT
jgi:AmmeMemoRadiSam system protein B